MAITVKLIGVLRRISGSEELAFKCKKLVSVRELFSEVIEKLPKLKQSLIDQQLNDLNPNVLVLVNGSEISVLNGLQTKLKNNDEIVLVPVVHGG